MGGGLRVLVLVLAASFLFFGVRSQTSFGPVLDVCEEYVPSNELMVDGQLLTRIDSQQIRLQRLVECLENGGSLTFTESQNEVETLQIENSISIQGSQEENISITCIDGPVFIVNALRVEMSNLEIIDCQLEMQDAPVTVRSGGSLQLNAVNFANNTNAVGPAAVRTDEGAQLNIDGSVFGHNSGNRSTIYITDGSSLTVSNSRLVNNRANLGGGVLLIDSQQERTTVMIEGGSEFHGNEALTGEGGAIFAIGNVSLAITDDTIFRRNVAALQGGALFFSGHSTLTIEDAFFVENESNFSGGGAIYAQNSMNEDLDIQISNTIFSKNAAANHLGSGGAIRLHGSRITCNIERGISFISNVAELDGAAIHISDSTEVNISEAFFIGNEVHEGGGASLFAVSSAYSGSSMKLMNLHITSSTFVSNRAVYGRRGGGTIGSTAMGAQIFIDRCRFHGNEAMFGAGGVIHLYEGPFIIARKSSFIDNKAVWGGVIYGQLKANFNMSKCIFHRNEAEEGGAISARGIINVDIVDSDLKNNSAKEEGGAIRAENHDYSGSESARLIIKNSSFANNNAGFEMRQGGLDIESTRGGGIAAIGAGQYMVIDNTTFYNNSASEGGAVAAIGPGQFLVSNQTIFENNFANFGSAIFVSVNNAIDIWRGRYQITGARFINNTANSDGGAVRVGSSTLANNLFPYNARRRTVVFKDCVFRNNRALNLGGGLMVIGVGLELDDVSFTSNIAVQNAGLSMSGSGGGIAAIDGASVKIANSDITSNIAYLSGGGLFVMDSSVAISKSNFTQNSLREGYGNGGAVALTLTANRLLPILESGERQVPILFECNNCDFVGNKATLYGGAIYYRNSDPYANYTEDWNCENTDVSTFTEFQNAPEFNLTCVWIIRTRDRLRSRVIRLSRVLFESNRAHSGAALFTNNPAMIKITNGEPLDLGNSFVDTVKNESALNEFGIIFRDNEKAEDGYGQDYSSYPVRACFSKEMICDNEVLPRNELQTGDSLDFRLELYDAFAQRVTHLNNLTAVLDLNESNSDNALLPIVGPDRAQLKLKGYIEFSETRVQGPLNTLYTLALSFFLDGEALTMTKPLYINITIRLCRVGQVLSTTQGSRMCVDCGVGQFSANPKESTCKSCADVEGGKCHGSVAIPENHYWHSSSLSMKMFRCIGQDACSYEDRSIKINETEFYQHMNNAYVSYSTDENRVQCAPGYRGILCGSCMPGYGREGESCRECASKGVSYFLLLMLILWSIIFIRYFIRSILQLSKRIEFNKKSGRLPILSPSRKYAHKTLPNALAERKESEIQEDDVEKKTSNSFPSQQESILEPIQEQASGASLAVPLNRKDVARAKAAQINRQRTFSRLSKSVGSSSQFSPFVDRQHEVSTLPLVNENRDPSTDCNDELTLANPVSELLKVLINFLQVTSVAVSINMNWNRAVRGTLISIGSAANLGTGSGFFSLDCFLETGVLEKSLKRMIIAVLFPVALFLFFEVIWGIYSLSKNETLRFFLKRSWLTFIAIVYFFYIGMTKNLLRFFACVRIEEDVEDSDDSDMTTTLNGYYWEEDTDVQCYKDNHALTVIILVIPLLCIVTIGFPLGTFIILQLNAKHLEDEDVIRTYGFLYQAYNRHYWEIIIMLRKASIATIVVFVYTLQANMQGLLCVLVLVISLSLHLSFVPFKREMGHLNYLETCSLSASITVFVSGLMFNDRVTNNAAEIFLSILSILCVVGTLSLILISLVFAAEEFIDMKLLEHDLMKQQELLDKTVFEKLRKLLSHYCAAVTSLVPFFKQDAAECGDTLHPVLDSSLQLTNKSETQ